MISYGLSIGSLSKNLEPCVVTVYFVYMGASAICRVPMAIFEASFLGIKFTTIRLLVSLPLVILTSKLLGGHFSERGYRREKRS